MPWTPRGSQRVAEETARRPDPQNDNARKLDVQEEQLVTGKVRVTVKGEKSDVLAYVAGWLHDNAYARDGRVVRHSEDDTHYVLERWWRM